MRELILWGATGQAKVLREALWGTDCEVVALVDNRDVPSPFPGMAVLRGESGLDDWLARRGDSTGLYGAVAVGGGRGGDRLALMELMVARALVLLTVVHRTAFVAADAFVGSGCQILAQSAVCACAKLGDGVIVNTSAAVDHDCVIGRGVHIGPGARLAGEVTVGEKAFIGMGAVVLPRLRIGENAVIGAAAVVTKDVAPGVTVVGAPARPTDSTA